MQGKYFITVLLVAAVAAVGSAAASTGPTGGGADPQPDRQLVAIKVDGQPVTCGPGMIYAVDPVSGETICTSVSIYIDAQPNPVTAGGTVNYYVSVTPWIDCNDSPFGHNWDTYPQSFGAVATVSFLYTLTCFGGSGLVSQSRWITVNPVEGDPDPPGDPPPPPGATPAIVNPPQISGNPVVGQVLTTSNGVWTNCNPTCNYEYRWKRIDVSPPQLIGVTAKTLTLTEAHLDKTYSVDVRAQNDIGWGVWEASPDQLGPVTAPAPPPAGPPAVVTVPSISGDPIVGQTLSTSNGSWTNCPCTYEYQWERADMSPPQPIGVTTNTLTLTEAHTGQTLRAKVRASNALGHGLWQPTSNQAGPVIPETVPDLEGESFAWGASGEEKISGYGGNVKCKWQDFSQTFSFRPVVGGPRVIALRYAGTFKVCYRPGKEILSVPYVSGDATWVGNGWWWQGNDPGYPSVENRGSHVRLHFRGTVKLCVYPPICSLGSKHPWIRITFYPNNTMTKEVGAV